MKELDEYIINCETLLILPFDYNKSIVHEIDNSYIVNKKTFDIINDSCLFFGNTFNGKCLGTTNLIDCKIKVPIIVEDSKCLIFFPSNSYKNFKCVWVSYNNMLKYSKYDTKSTMIYFKNNKNIIVEVKFNIIDNQVIRCIKLESIINKRRKVLIED